MIKKWTKQIGKQFKCQQKWPNQLGNDFTNVQNKTIIQFPKTTNRNANKLNIRHPCHRLALSFIYIFMVYLVYSERGQCYKSYNSKHIFHICLANLFRCARSKGLDNYFETWYLHISNLGSMGVFTKHNYLIKVHCYISLIWAHRKSWQTRNTHVGKQCKYKHNWPPLPHHSFKGIQNKTIIQFPTPENENLNER